MKRRDWTSCSRCVRKRPASLGPLTATELMQWYLLVSVFDGDPDRWWRYLQQHGSAAQKSSDLPFVERLRKTGTQGGAAKDLKTGR